MKIRNGFVSNSSSSSFCLIGSSMDDDSYEKFLGDDFVEGEWWKNQEKVREKLEGLGMEVHDGECMVVFGYPVETDTTIDSQIEWAKEEWKRLNIDGVPFFDYGEVCSG